MALIRWIFATDPHGDQVDPEAVKRLLAFTEEWKPKYRIHGGDGMDLRAYRRGAPAEEREEGISRDVAAHLHFLEQWRPHVFLEGNHDDRLREQAEYGSEEKLLTEFSRTLQDRMDDHYRRSKIAIVKYSREMGRDDFWQAPEGGHYFAHGRHHSIHASKNHHELYEHAVITGHVHRYSSYQGRNGVSYSSPCLADICKLRYDRHRPGKWKHRNGWMFGVVNSRSGRSEAWHVIRDGDEWISPLGKI